MVNKAAFVRFPSSGTSIAFIPKSAASPSPISSSGLTIVITAWIQNKTALPALVQLKDELLIRTFKVCCERPKKMGFAPK